MQALVSILCRAESHQIKYLNCYLLAGALSADNSPRGKVKKIIALALLASTSLLACIPSNDDTDSGSKKKTLYGRSVEKAHELQTPSAADEALKKQAEDLSQDE